MSTVEDMDTTATRTATGFFADYTKALLERDADTIAGLYAVPALILFPGQSLPVTSREQTREFFTGAFGQYQDVRGADTEITVPAATSHSIWVDVRWRYDTGATERMLYQLVRTGQQWRIAVLTPLDD